MPPEQKKPETPAEDASLTPPATPENPPSARLAAEPATPQPSGLKRAGAFLFKLILFLFILGGIGAALYFGLPLVYDKYLLPVQQNTAKLAALETQQAQANQQLADLQTQVTNLQAQIQAGVTEQSRQTQALDKLTGRVEHLEDEIQAHTQTLAALEAAQTSLREQNQTASAELDRQIKLLKSMELLSRARLFLYQSNFGLAKVDVQAARSLLAEIQPAAPAPLAQELAEVLQRLDLTLGNLPNFPVAASDDLDIAWQVLLQGLPAPTPTATLPAITETPTPEATLVPAPTATP